MIYIVHGDDHPKNRKLVINQQKNFPPNNRTEKNIEDTTPKELYELLNSVDIFGSRPSVILNVPKGKITDADEYVRVINKTPKDAVLIIFSKDTMLKSNEFIKNAKGFAAKVVLNEKPKTGNVFGFVDMLMSKNKNSAHKALEDLKEEGADPFYILSMISYGLRNVAQAKEPGESFSSKTPFVKSKAEKQARNFSKEEILKLFDLLYQTDKKVKTGKMDTEIALPYLVEKITDF